MLLLHCQHHCPHHNHWDDRDNYKDKDRPASYKPYLNSTLPFTHSVKLQVSSSYSGPGCPTQCSHDLFHVFVSSSIWGSLGLEGGERDNDLALPGKDSREGRSKQVWKEGYRKKHLLNVDEGYISFSFQGQNHIFPLWRSSTCTCNSSLFYEFSTPKKLDPGLWLFKL